MVLNSTWQPALVLEIELSNPLPNIPPNHYTRAQVLIRLHTAPLGLVELAFNDEVLQPEDYAKQIYAELGEEINQHLRQNGLEAVQALSPNGIQQEKQSQNLQERDKFLSDNPPFVTVAVATRNRGDQLRVSLATLVKQAYPNYEILLIDNAPSNDDAQRLVEEHYSDIPFLRYIREERPGAAWARNRAIHEARGEILMYTDDDVLVDQYWVSSIAQAFSCAENVGGVSGLTLPAEMETEAQELFEQFNSFSNGYERIVHNTHTLPLTSPLYPYNSLNFAACVNMAYRTAILREIGGFDPALGPGSLAKSGEDMELYLRVVMKGYSIVYEPTALVYHFHRRDYAYLQHQTYEYGVAFTAFATSFLIRHPGHVLRILRLFPRILQELLSNSAPRKARRKTNFPKELRRSEYRGWLYGPIAYWRSRRRVRQIASRFGKLESIDPAPPTIIANSG